MGASAKRRLAAILASDMVGYSRLMEADEHSTMARLKAHRLEVIEPSIAANEGWIVKTTGDGMLVEFASVVDAVNCAAAIQRAISEHEQDVGEDHRIQYRIGINLGDIIIEGDDIFGDGVNIAARLETMADPGGIVISGTAFDHLKRKVDVGYEYLGEKQVKNIAEPVRAYRVLTEPSAAGTLVGAKHLRRRYWQVGAVGVISLAVAGGGLAWIQPWAPEFQPASVERMAYPLPDRPSIAVLPFATLSDDMGQDYFADGMTEDLITDLSKISALFVIARNSSFAYKGQPVEIRRIAEELGVRYVLEGSVRRAGDQIRINAQLIDATTGGHLWAERYDGSLTDVFALQDDVTRNIVTALAVNLTVQEEARQGDRYTTNVEAYDAFLQGWEFYQRYSAADFIRAIVHFERAIELDPDYGRAYAALASLHWKTFRQGESWAMKVNPDANNFVSVTITRAKVGKYLKLAMRHPSPLAHQVASAVRWQYRQFDEAVAEAEKAVALNPNDPDGYVAVAWAQIFSGRPGQASEAVGRALRLDPQRPGNYSLVLGMAQISLGNYQEAVAVLSALHERSPEYRDVNVPLAVALAHLGDIDAAKAAIKRYVDDSIAFQTNIADIMGWWPFRREADFRDFAGALIKAGLGSEEAINQRIHFLRLGGTLQ